MLPSIEVIIINWKRPENVERIVKALKSQTVLCTITVCDCHNNPEFSLSESAYTFIDRLFKWEHNLGPFSRYVPLASYDHNYTFFIDDDILPGKKCLETFLQAAAVKPDFGVLGQMGRILSNDGSYNIFQVGRDNSGGLVEVDFIIRAYFVKTRNLHNLVKFRWQIGHFQETRLQDDLLMCASLKYYENLGCFLLPGNDDPETRVNKEELDPEHAFSSSADHYENRQNFVDRIMYHGWKPINEYKIDIGTINRHANSETASPKVSICLIHSNASTDLNFVLDQVYNWDCCHEILVVNGITLNQPVLFDAFSDPEKKIKYISGQYKDAFELRNSCAEKVTGAYLLILDSYEHYSKKDLQLLKEDIINNPDIDLFKFDFSHDANKRNYFYLWRGLDSHIIGEYWDIPQYRIYKWRPGTKFTDTSRNNPVLPNGRTLTYPSPYIKAFTTQAKCINLRFSTQSSDQDIENIFFDKIEEIDNTDIVLSSLKQKYIDCKQAYENWSLHMPLPPNVQIYPFQNSISKAISCAPKLFTNDFLNEAKVN